MLDKYSLEVKQTILPRTKYNSKAKDESSQEEGSENSNTNQSSQQKMKKGKKNSYRKQKAITKFARSALNN
jgi:hypothetical protein